MTNYGAAPASDQVEVTLFGPGYGEAIVLHLGEGVWLMVDSCIDPESKQPASGSYLEGLGVKADQVRAIIASHWHDDHVRGISKLASAYPAADFVLSAVFNNMEASAFLAAYGGKSSAGLARGGKELFGAVEGRNNVFPALHRSIVFQDTLNGRPVIVTALSPLPAAYAAFLANLAQYLPTEGDPINHAPELRPNMEAVTLHLDLGSDAILLGADLEEHQAYGWSAVVSDSWSGARKPSTAYKVAHHGSVTGHCPEVWATLLQTDPVACLTPFSLGSVGLPTEGDATRLRAHTKHVHVTSATSRRPEMDSRLLKRMSTTCKKLARADGGFGAVRLRKGIGASTWNVELFGAARTL